MKTQNNKLVDKTVKILKEGGIVILPTDTVYGIFGLSDNKKAINKIYRIKKRDRNKPFQIFLASKNEIKKYAILNTNKKFINKYLPGKYTLIFKIKKDKKRKFPFINGNTIGIRIIKYGLLNKIIKKIKKPLAATSANLSGMPSPKSFNEINGEILGKVDFYIKDDSIVSGTPSGVIDVSEGFEKVLR